MKGFASPRAFFLHSVLLLFFPYTWRHKRCQSIRGRHQNYSQEVIGWNANCSWTWKDTMNSVSRKVDLLPRKLRSSGSRNLVLCEAHTRHPHSYACSHSVLMLIWAVLSKASVTALSLFCQIFFVKWMLIKILINRRSWYVTFISCSLL